MLSDAAVLALTRRLQAALTTVGQRAAAAALVAWDELDSYDRDQIATFSRRVTPAVQGSRSVALSLGVGYYASLTQVRPPAVRLTAVTSLFDPSAGFLATWHALKEGRPFDEAVAAGRSMTEASVSNAVVSTSRRAGDAVMESAGIRTLGWRRVLDGKACEWCQVVSTQRYRTAESADFGHDRCGCTAVPIIGDRDPGRVVNRELLKQLKADGAVDNITRQQQLPRARQALDGARSRVDRLRSEIASERDQERETRLERRLDKALQDVKQREKRVSDLEALRR